jgi:SET family sugar efflux transporter-like MFS transporter
VTAVLTEPAARTRRTGQLRQWYPLALVFLSVGLSTAMAFPFLTLFLTDTVHAVPLQVTFYLIAAPLSSVLLSTVVGHWSDKRPIRRRLIISAAVIGCCGALLTSVIRDYWILLALTVTATAAAGSIMPQLFAYARMVLYGSDRAAMTMSTLRMLFSLSWVAGPFLATVLLATGGFTLVYGFAATMYALAGLLAWRLLPEPPPLPPSSPALPLSVSDELPPVPSPVVPAPGLPVSPARPEVEPDAARRVIVMTIVAFALLQCAGNIGVQAMSLFISGELGGGLDSAGLILGLCAGLEIPLMLGFGLLSTRLSLRRMILIGPLCSFAYALTVGTATHTWQVAAAQIFNASAVALIQGLGVTYVQDMLPRQPGRASTLFSNAFPAGAVLAGPILGAAQHFGYRAAYMSGAVLTVVAFVLLFFARPKLGHASLRRE